MDQREAVTYAPITEDELDAWEVRARENGTGSPDDLMRLIAEVRRLRHQAVLPRVTRIPGKCGGAPTIAGTRIGVAEVVALARRYNWDLERVRAQEFPDLSLADVEAAVEYYRTHEAEIEEVLCRDQERRDSLPPAPTGR